MSTRLICMRWPTGRPGFAARARELASRVSVEEGWETIIDRMGVLAIMRPDARDVAPVILPDELGVILGRMFSRAEEGSSRLLIGMTKPEAFEFVSGSGQELVRSHWGPYGAVLHDRFANRLRIVRDPMGARPIFHTSVNGLSIAFTHLRDLFMGGVNARIDDTTVRAFLIDVRLVAERTGLDGVRELLAGCELSLNQDGVAIECVWRPTQCRRWTYGAFADAVAAVKAAGLHVGRAWAAALPRALHRLSGGLDSSIALSLLTEDKECLSEVVAINEFSAYAESDERVQARAAAAWFGAQLIEREVRPEEADYATILRHEPEAKPTLAALGFADEGLATAVADFVGAPLTSGQGGDQVFHRSSRPVLVADAVRDGLSARDVWKVAYENALLARRPVWDGIAIALRHGVLRLPIDALAQLESPMVWRQDDRDVSLLTDLWGAHPWNPVHESPARAERVRRIIDLTYYHQASPLTTLFQNSPILTSQPLVEACLATAPYLMSAHAQDRALARAAFGDRLPACVLKRQTKGETTRFVAEMLRRNLPFARDVLIAGRLVERGIVSPEAVDQFTLMDVMDGFTKAKLMRSLAAELWLRRVEAAQAAARETRPAKLDGLSGDPI